MNPEAAVPLLRVKDVARSAAWYRETLGFAVDPFPETPPYAFAILRRGKAEIMLSCSEAGRPAGWKGWDVYVRLQSGLRELHARLELTGVVTRGLQRMFYGMAEFDARDPDGYVLCFGQDLADAGDLPAPSED